MLFVYGEQDPYFRDFESARTGEVGDIIRRAGSLVTVKVVPGRMHGLTSWETQDATISEVHAWVASLVTPLRETGGR